MRSSVLRVPVLVAFVLAVSLAGAFAADSAEGTAYFEQHIRPALAKYCYECHQAGPRPPKGGLLLDSRAGWQRGGDSGEPVIVPGDAEASLLIRLILHQEPGLEMPPEQPSLPADVIEHFASWVNQGAPDPRDGLIAARRGDASWWSLQPLADPKPPEILPEWPEWRSPIDRFIVSQLAESSLVPNPPADRRQLIRRVSYDLTGLPPTPEEILAFENDSDPLAYEHLVDRLLDSPRYGEQWGRHWLDVVRFGESRGFERNEIINDAWPFRDYVIRSLNDDKPFNQFFREHLAGDLFAPDNPADEVGVAFLTLGPYDDVGNSDPVAAANIRAATVDEMVTTTGSAFLGLTINCARCHHHKFDPIPTEDYYRIKSALDGVSHGSRPLATPATQAKHSALRAPLAQRRDELQVERNSILNDAIAHADAAGMPPATRPAPNAHFTEETFDPVSARFVRLTILATTANPASGAGARIDEFEVWTAGEHPQNIALQSAGARASGVTAIVAQDFAEAYQVEEVNDGRYGARWFAGDPPVLTIQFAESQTIDRVTFSHDRIAESALPIPGQGPFLAEYELHVSGDGEVWTLVASSFNRAPATDALARERKLRAFLTPNDRAQLAGLDQKSAEVEAELNRVGPIPTAWQGHFQQPAEPTRVFRIGDPQQAGDVVAPASLAVLPNAAAPFELPADAPEGERRMALARWITNDGNPLPARVLVNRLWSWHFGTGIVETPGDFGFLGGQPSHPKLLDWLARRLQTGGWRLKPLHREILLSQTYRQSGDFRDDAAAIDHDARLLWRFPPRRLSAEEVRDTMLTVAGKLDSRMGGPGFRLYDYLQDNVSTYVPLDHVGPETYRRAVYHQNARASVVDVLSDFDLPDNAFAAPTRGHTTTPLQSLTMLNHSFILDMAEAMAARAQAQAGPRTDEQVRAVWAWAYQREPLPQELAAAVSLAEQYGFVAVARALLNSNELLFVE